MSITNEEVNKSYDWICCNKLSLNFDETKFIIFRARNRRVPNDLNNLTIGGHDISRVENIQFLGVTVNEFLSWKPHISTICMKVSRSMGIISRLKFILPQNILITLYYSLILPHLTYCNSVWGHTFKSHLSRLLILQKKAIRLISSSPYNCPSIPLFKKMNILPISELISMNSLIFMYKYKSGILPKIFENMFTLNSTIHNYNTRQSILFHQPKVSSSMALNSFRVKYIKLWNSLDQSIQQSSTLSKFKFSLKRLYFAKMNAC